MKSKQGKGFKSTQEAKDYFEQEAREEYPVLEDEDFDYGFDRYNCWRHLYYPYANEFTSMYGREISREAMVHDIARHISLEVDGYRCSMERALTAHMDMFRYYGASTDRMRAWYRDMVQESLHSSIKQGDVRRAISRAMVQDILKDAATIEVTFDEARVLLGLTDE